MSKSGTKKQLTQLYCDTYISAATLGDFKLCIHLSKSGNFDYNYIQTKYGDHIINFAALIGDVDTFNKSFDVLASEGQLKTSSTLLHLLCNAAHSGNMKIIDKIVGNADQFSDYKDKIYNFTSALRYASEDGHAKVVDFLISNGAKPNDWHVLKWSADKAPGNTYRRILKANGLDPKASRKNIKDFCDKLFKEMFADWSVVNIEELKKYLEDQNIN